MFLHSFVSQLKDSISNNLNNKYKLRTISYNDPNNIKVTCDVLDKPYSIEFQLNEIMQENKLKYFSTNDILQLSNAYYNRNHNNLKIIKAQYQYFNTLALTFILCLIISNLGAIKICNFFGFSLPGGTVIFPVLYVLNDIITEVYGFSASRRVIWYGLLCSSIVSFTLFCITLIPSTDPIQNNEHFNYVFFISPKIFIASILSYFIGELINSIIIAYLKVYTKGTLFPLRAILSTSVGALIESGIFIVLCYIGLLGFKEMVNMILMLAAVKVMYELISIIFSVKVVVFLKKQENYDVFELPSLKKIIASF